MASYIQSRVYLIHRVESQKPTTDTKPTEPKLGGDGNEAKDKPISPSTNEKNIEVNDEAGVKRVVGSVSVKRRLTNLAIGTALSVATLGYQEEEFKQSFIGNSRGSQKIQQEKQVVAGVAQLATSALSTGFTAAALGNPAIIAIFAVGQAMQLLNRTMTYFQQMEHYTKEKEREIFESRYANDRLVRNVYNRR